jgi:hypothetical protein
MLEVGDYASLRFKTKHWSAVRVIGLKFIFEGPVRSGAGYTAVGVDALLNNLPETQPYKRNSAFGYKALITNTSGDLNTAIGAYTLQANVDGNRNTATGDIAAYNNTSGNDNTAIGYRALYSNAGDGNTATGSAALYGNTTGTRNTATGRNALITPAGKLGVMSSSRRYKEAIEAMADTSARLHQLRPVTFRYKKPSADATHPMQYGLALKVSHQVLKTEKDTQITELQQRVAQLEGTASRLTALVERHVGVLAAAVELK